jgi:hypothetical protein
VPRREPAELSTHYHAMSMVVATLVSSVPVTATLHYLVYSLQMTVGPFALCAACTGRSLVSNSSASPPPPFHHTIVEPRSIRLYIRYRWNWMHRVHTVSSAPSRGSNAPIDAYLGTYGSEYTVYYCLPLIAMAD